MEWHVTDAQSLAIIDSEIGDHVFSPAEYEIVRRVIYATADFEYASLIQFSERALQAAAAALASRTTIIVDVPMAQVGIAESIQNTFANEIYCTMDIPPRPQKEKTRVAWGIENLAKRYPEGVFVIGQSQTALASLVRLVEAEEIRPALIVATPAGFIGAEEAKEHLRDSLIPNITIDGRKGCVVVAAAILDGLIDLAWKAYGNFQN
ncbi:precorrin-8X methylmutase [Calothrix sp. 336/3]|uniref:precorrin-8X methylmutase n=1 Tax=Calothrix sp. 336/3 TaxID=1337936 RepID=UPI0004E3886E|nr:precorrin-8X methylmutase [Calothrix sp. 336/3]AKG22821.1 precorrin-8X methylmutase [Calothrix sp. 336/3]